jgi:DNA-binding transcriptional LysR family regulator
MYLVDDIVRFEAAPYKLAASRSVVVAAPEYLIRHGRPTFPTELQNHQCLTYTGSTAGAKWQFVVNNHVQNVLVSGRIQANNGDVLMQAVMRGLGIAYLLEFIVWTVSQQVT